MQTPSLVYVIDSDIAFLTLLNKIKEKFPFDLKTESDPKEAIKQLKSDFFTPHALIVAKNFPGCLINGFEIIEEVKNKSLFFSALILNPENQKENIETRVKAMEYKIDYVFQKPLYAYTFLQSLKEGLELRAKRNFKVLILDDDEDFCHIASDILQEARMDVRAIHSAISLFDTLDTFSPDLLLLDIKLPEYDGLNLLKALRQDVNYADLKIVIITAQEESTTKLQAFSAKADEIIYKPIDPLLFQKRLLNFAERSDTMRESFSLFEKTGMQSFKDLTLEIHRCLEIEHSGSTFLAVFEVDKFENWMEKHSVQQGQDLLISITNELLLEIDAHMSCYNDVGSKFALLFEKKPLEEVDQKIRALLENLRLRESFSHIGFNCGIIKISKDLGNAEQNTKAADNALIEAGKKEKSPLRIYIDNAEVRKDTKEIVLIDPDEQLVKILKRNFEPYGIQVLTFSNGDSALENLLKRKEKNLPSLIILERKLEGMDGIDIIIKLKEHFKHPLPFYILTFFGADKDIIEGIKEGALEYITKPFNTSILMEKVLKTLNQQ